MPPSFEQLVRDFLAFLSQKSSYSEKFGQDSFERTARRIWFTKMEIIVTSMGFSFHAGGKAPKDSTRAQRSTARTRSKNKAIGQLRQGYFPLINDTVRRDESPSPDDFQSNAVREFCQWLYELAQVHGVDRSISQQWQDCGCGELLRLPLP